jgi:hypothetical protein
METSVSKGQCSICLKGGSGNLIPVLSFVLKAQAVEVRFCESCVIAFRKDIDEFVKEKK